MSKPVRPTIRQTILSSTIRGTLRGYGLGGGAPAVAPVFSGTIPAQEWTVDEAITPLDVSGYFGSPSPAPTYSVSAGALPAGLSLNTSSGVISGTPTTATTGSFTIGCSNVAGSDDSNSVAWETVAAVVLPAFAALTYDPDTYEMVGVLTGTGGLTTTHTSVLYAPDVDGVYQKFPANAPVWSGGRCVLTGSAGSDVSAVYANDGGGTPLAEVPYLQYYPAATNLQESSNDFVTGSYWSKANVTPTYDQVGLTGAPNTATLCPASLNTANVRGDFTCTSNGTAVWYMKKTTSAAAFPGVRCFIDASNRAAYTVNTDTGALVARTDAANGGTYSAEIISVGDWWKILIELSGATRRQETFPFVNTDASGAWTGTGSGSCIIGNCEGHADKTIAQVRGLGPIFTTTAAVSTDETLYDFDVANHPTFTNMVYYSEYVMSNASQNTANGHFWSAKTYAEISERTDSGRAQWGYVNSSDADSIFFYQSVSGTVDTLRRSGCAAHDATNQIVGQLDGNSTAVQSNFKNSLVASYFRVGNRTNSYSFKARQWQIYTDFTDFAEAEAALDGLMVNYLTGDSFTDRLTDGAGGDLTV